MILNNLVNFVLKDRRNDKSLETHTHKMKRPKFESQSWCPTLAISIFLSVEL
jgi:hypothetical protein